MGELAGCLFQSIIKFILIFSPLINTLLFTIYQITLYALQMELLPCLLHYVNNLFPSMDWSYLPLIQHLFLFYRKLNIFLHQWVNLLRCLLQYVKLPLCHSLWFTLKLSPQIDKISYMSLLNDCQLQCIKWKMSPKHNLYASPHHHLSIFKHYFRKIVWLVAICISIFLASLNLL